jgi:hypothetical protein
MQAKNLQQVILLLQALIFTITFTLIDAGKSND